MTPLDRISQLTDENAQLRARVAELEHQLKSEIDARNGWWDNCKQAEQRNAELEAALRDMRDACKGEPAMNRQKYDALGIRVNNLLASAESAAPAKHPDTERLDWLEAQPSKYEWAVTLDHGCVFVTRNKTSGRPSIRAAIDTARKQETA